jgi:hypothetical protein
MTSLLTRSARSAFRSAAATTPSTTSAGSSAALLPTSTQAKLILSRAGFDTPIAAAQQTANLTTKSPAAGCPIAGSTTSSLVPSIFSASSRCPCGLYPSSDVPQDCPSAQYVATTGYIQKQPSSSYIAPLTRVNPSASVRIHARAFSSVATKQDQAATSTVTATPAAPSAPPAVNLPGCLSSAHAALLAIDDYRGGVQALSKGSLASARGLLLRTKDIVSYVPGQPWMGIFTRHLLACIASAEGRWKEEHRLRSETMKEVEKIWGKPTSASAVASDVLTAASMLASAHALACLRSDSRAELRAMIEAWLPRVEALLFGRPPSPIAGIKQQPFTTGATHLKLLAFYGALLQVGLHERATRSATPAAIEIKQPVFLRSIQQLSKSIAARPHLQSSQEWKLFQGELLLLPASLREVEGFAELLPTAPAADSSSSSHLHRAVRYFTAHPELQRVSLSESHLIREWYSPFVQAAWMAAEEGLTATPKAAGGGAPAPVDEQLTPSSLLHSTLAFIESTLSSSPSSPALLRTLLALAKLSAEEGEAVQAEGLLRNVSGKADAALGVSSTSSSDLRLSVGWMSLYLDSVVEHASLLTRLEWNKVSRLAEAKSVLLQRIYQPARRDASIHALMESLRPTTMRTFLLPKSRDELPRTTEEITDEMVRLEENRSEKRVPQWIQEKLHIGSGVA